MEKTDNVEFEIYHDIRNRTNGEIYLGVTGPVRTGKSIFIKRFMELLVLPYMEDENQKQRAVDELPQSAQGKTIMTTEPKFVPQEAADIELEDHMKMKVRLVDCVGFTVPGAEGYMEDDENRMVKTPWFAEEIPFEEAARIGTRKVIRDHATIGIVMTTDGSIGEIPRANYLEAERETIHEMCQIHKPFVVILNCVRPYSEETKLLVKSMENEYHAPVLAMNCKQMKEEDITHILRTALYEFPVAGIAFYIPKWTELLQPNHPIKEYLIAYTMEVMNRLTCLRDLTAVENGDLLAGNFGDCDYITSVNIIGKSLSDGMLSMKIEVADHYYYEYMSEMTGDSIDGEYQLICKFCELSQSKREYDRVKEALAQVWQKGYGVVMPELADISMEEPVLIQHGNKYGVKIKAMSPSVHMIKANIETEIAPIVGSREQAEDLIKYIEMGESSNDGVWTTNIFGKSLGELIEDGIRSKIVQMDDECQMKLQDTMQKIVNDSKGGMICIII